MQEHNQNNQARGQAESSGEETSGVRANVLTPGELLRACLLYTSPSPRDQRGSRMPSSA